MHFPRYPGVNLAITCQQTARSDQTGRVEDLARIAVVFLQKTGSLNVDAVLLGFLLVAVGVLVRDRHGEPIQQFLYGWIDRGGVAELRKYQQAHREKRRIAN